VVDSNNNSEKGSEKLKHQSIGRSRRSSRSSIQNGDTFDNNQYGRIGNGLELIKEQTSMSRASLKSLPESPSKHHKILTEDSLSNRRRINEADEVFETSEHYKDNNYSILKSFQIM
jgi:hypothetical protein